MGARQDDFINGICSPGSLGMVKYSWIVQPLMLYSYQMEMLSLTFQVLQSGKYYVIFFNKHNNNEYLHWNVLKSLVLVPFANVLIRYCNTSLAPYCLAMKAHHYVVTPTGCEHPLLPGHPHTYAIKTSHCLASATLSTWTLFMYSVWPALHSKPQASCYDTKFFPFCLRLSRTEHCPPSISRKSILHTYSMQKGDDKDVNYPLSLRVRLLPFI